MNRLIVPGLAALLLAACGQSDETAAPQAAETAPAAPTPAPIQGEGPMPVYLRHLDSLSTAIEAVKDEASLQAALETIRASEANIREIGAGFEGKTDEEKDAIFGQYVRQVVEAQGRFQTALGRVGEQNPDWMRQLDEELRKLPKVDN